MLHYAICRVPDTSVGAGRQLANGNRLATTLLFALPVTPFLENKRRQQKFNLI